MSLLMPSYRRWLAATSRALMMLLSCATLVHAQLKWTAYSPTTGAVLSGTTYENAATFDPATNSYAITIPANTAVTLVTTNLLPIDLIKPTSNTTQTITFQVKTSAGGFSTINKYTNFGLFNYPAASAPSATSSNASAHSGIWISAYSNGTATYQTKPSASPNASGYSLASAPDYKLASSNISQSATGFGLGTARTTGVGVIADETLYNVTFRVRGNSAGTTQLGSGSADASLGTLWTDAATGGTAFKQGVYSSTTNNGLTCPIAFNEFAYYFENGSSNAVTLTLANIKAYTSGGTAFNMGPAYVTVQPAPTITATSGGTASISATVVATNVASGPATTYLWQFSGDDGATYADVDSAANASAATTTLTLGSVQSSHAGRYRLKMTTSYTGAVSGAKSVVSYSDSSVLSVTTEALPPSVATPPANTTVLVGAPATLSVTAGGSTPLSFQWQKSTDAGATYADVDGAIAATYSIAAAQLADAGLYRVVISNAQGSVTSAAATLTVNQGPAITTQPIGGTLAPGGSLTLSVAATGTPAPTYQWKKNGATIAGATNASYTISGATGADTANYTVTVTNSVSSITSSAASVAVVSPTMAVSATTPVSASSGQNPDVRLTLTFNETPTAGVSGLIRIYDAATDTVVDSVDLVTATALRDTLRASSTLSTQLLPVATKPIGGITTNFNYYPLTITGNTVTIYPRNGVLAYGKTYYVKIDAGVIVAADGTSFAGINDATTWRFSTKASGPTSGATSLTVAADGSGDFSTVQAALDFIPASNTIPTTIRVARGTYFEQVGFQSKHFITLVGEDLDQTIIAYPNNNTFNNVSGVYHRATFVAQSVHDFTLANLTINNTTPQNGSQAEAVVLNGTSATTGKNIVTNCRFFSYQDTVQFNKQTYISDSTIIGDVDFMWGDGPSYFKNCDIRILRTGGYFTQIRNGNSNHGYVFVGCRFTAPAGITGTFLGRIDPNTGQYPYSEVVVLDSVFGDASNNAFLATATGVSGSNYLAGWWLLNNVTTATPAANMRNWDANNVDASGATLTNPNSDTFTTMPTDETTLANYRSALWVLNTNIAGTSNGTWTPALAPILTRAPAGGTVNAGDSITLTAAAVGVPSVSYQWRKNGDDILGATNASYVINNAGAGDAAGYTVVVTNNVGSVTSALATVNVAGIVVAPTIVTPPVDLEIAEGGSGTLTVVASGTEPLSYQWNKGVDAIPGATSASYTISNAAMGAAGSYSVTVTNAAGSVTSASATVTVKGVATIQSNGFSAGVTGGAAGATVWVSTAANLKAYAENTTTPYTIVLQGTIDLGVGGRIKLMGNKTLRGATTGATLLGTINISNVNNVIVSNLNISADTGNPADNDGVTISNSTNVLVTKCSIYNCTDGNLDVINGSDLVTVSWCKFYYTRDNGHNFSNLVGSSDTDTGSGDGLTNYRVTWHHNWWTGQAKQRMLACRFGRAHMYNNYWDCAGNDYCTESRNIAAILSEYNHYSGVKDPLAKRTALATDVGLLMTTGNVFVGCTGSQLVSSDVVFTPPYAYTVSLAADVPAIVMAGAGNVTTDTPATFTAAVSGSASAVAAGGSVTLTAVPTGFTPVSYQWRFQNAAISGATGAALSLSNVQSANTGDYTVVLGLADGRFVVSSPFALSLLTNQQAWRQANFGTTANSGNAADAADPDGDGVANVVEYLLGGTPTSAASSPWPTGQLESGVFTYRFTRALAASDVSYAVQQSTDLVTWTTVTPMVESSTATTQTLVVALSPTLSKQFLRLTVGGQSTAPLGYLKVALAGSGATTTFGMPLDDPQGPITGIRAGKIDAVSATTLTSTGAGWGSGVLAGATAPWSVRMTSGAAVGRVFPITANTATTLTLSGASLTTLGVVAGDTFELLAVDTLDTFFGGTTLAGAATAASADQVKLYGTAWVGYYYNTTSGNWRLASGPTTNYNTIALRSTTGAQVLRRGSALTLTLTGRVSPVGYRVPVANAGGTLLNLGYPMDTTLAGLAVQTKVAGWRSGTTTAADQVSLYNGSAWVAYVHNGTYWQSLSGGLNSDAVAIPAGSAILITRSGTTAGTTDFIQSRPY